jgi:hypothetical protein
MLNPVDQAIVTLCLKATEAHKAGNTDAAKEYNKVIQAMLKNR